MKVRGGTAGVVGGSIAGCAAAIALERLGCEVTVFERSSGALRDRGSGIAIPRALRDRLAHAGYLPSDYPGCDRSTRHWVHADGSDSGRLIWSQPSAATMCNWGVLWRSLRERISGTGYLDDSPVVGVRDEEDGATLTFQDGGHRRFQLVVGADGYRSTVGSMLHPNTEPTYAGYLMWRGNFPESRLQDRRLLDRMDAADAWMTVCFPGGHGLVYPIPDFDGKTDRGKRRINWVIYAAQPAGLNFDRPVSIPPGGVSARLHQHYRELVERYFPPLCRGLFDSPHEEISIQPVYDRIVDCYARNRVLLIGDAGSVSRPHTASGATKALQDALQIEALGARSKGWPSLLASYDEERTRFARSLVELGRRMGRDQVQQTPPWPSMTAQDMDLWTKATLDGETHYFYGNAVTSRPGTGPAC